MDEGLIQDVKDFNDENLISFKIKSYNYEFIHTRQ